MAVKRKFPRKPLVWKDEFYVLAYDLAKAGMTDCSIAKALGVTQTTFDKWKREKTALANALATGRTKQDRVKGETQGETLQDYVYKRLPEALKELWDDLNSIDKINPGPERVERLLREQSKRVRQHLFVHALLMHAFNASEACRLVNISRPILQYWNATDPTFAELVQDILWHKKNYFESRLVELVQEGNPLVTMMVNRTLNRDRGYGDKVEIKHSGSIDQKHQVTVKSLNLSLDTRKELLERMRKVREGKQTTPLTVEHKEHTNGQAVG